MINKVILIGNVGMDPEIRTIENGAKVARVRLATTERMYNRQTQEAKDHTEWHTITLWRNLADTVDRFVKKGSKIYIEGKLRTRSWTDQSGAQRYSTEIQADDIKLLDRRPDDAQTYQQPSRNTTEQSQPTAQVAVPSMDDNTDDLPF